VSAEASAGAIRYERVGPAAVVTLDRPAAMNAFTPAMVPPLIAALDRADADDEVRAVIVTGAGRAFSAGADLSAGEQIFDFARDAAAAVAHRDAGGILTLRLLRCAKPVIAALNGAAVGMGITITLPMDVRIASSRARFGFVFARRGMVPEGASAWFLPRIVGIGRAQEWVCTGRMIDASEALAAGLVHAVHEPDDVLPAAHRVVEEIAQHTAPVSVALSRRMLWDALGAPVGAAEAHRVDSLATVVRGGSADVAEGVAAFLDKRAPRFPMRVSDGLPPIVPW